MRKERERKRGGGEILRMRGKRENGKVTREGFCVPSVIQVV